MRKRGQPTEAELRRAFDEALRLAADEAAITSDTGLDSTVDDALIAIAEAAPNPPRELIRAAEAAFAGQLDGSNAAAQRRRSDEYFGKFQGTEALT